jgi:hypothetical protein
VRKQLPGTPSGDPASAPVIVPREPNGKLYKRLLRERYWAGHRSLVT